MMKAHGTRFGAWLYKEWRDQRPILLGILVAVPALTALAYAVFGDNLATARLDNVQSVFLAIAVGLVVFAIAGDLFAGENRRGTIHAVRRLPGAMGPAFTAKVAFLLLALALVVTLQGLSLAVAEHLNHDAVVKAGITGTAREGGHRGAAVLAQLGAFPTSTFWLVAFGFGAFGLWTLLVSTWMGRSGVAGLGAAVLLAGLAAPFVLFFREHPWFFPGPKLLAVWATGVGAVVALAATALCFLRGQRHAGRPFRPFLLGLGLLGLALGGSYAYGHQALRSWVRFGPEVEGFAIHYAHVGADGRHLYLTVARGGLWDQGRATTPTGGDDGWRAGRGTPAQVWVVDLEDGSWTPVDERAPRYMLDVPEADVAQARSLDPAEALVCYRTEGEQQPTLRWWDARTATAGRALPFGVRDAAALELVRRQLRARSWVRDGEGRRVWLRDGVIERDGEAFDAPTAPVARPEGRRHFLHARPVPGGWAGYTHPFDRFLPFVLDASTGQYVRVPSEQVHDAHWTERLLSPEHVLVGRGTEEEPWAVLAMGTGAEPTAVRNPPAVAVGVVARDEVLALRGPDTGRSLHVWNPRSGADRALAWVGAEAPAGLTSAGVLGRTGDGRALLILWRQQGIHEGRPEHAYAVLGADARTLRLVVPFAWRHTGLSGGKGRGELPLALLPDDALVLLRGGREVVRVAPGGATEVLFPRR